MPSHLRFALVAVLVLTPALRGAEPTDEELWSKLRSRSAIAEPDLSALARSRTFLVS